LVNDILYRALATHFYRAAEKAGAHQGIEGLDELDKVIAIDQSPIGRTPRSNPATYTNVFGHIRNLMAKTPEARQRGYKPGRFSFNVKGGRCEACKGDGQIKIEMHFLPDIYVTCEVCGGQRYDRETLTVTYKGLNIAEILDLSVEQAREVFRNIPAIDRILTTLDEVGLGYIHLGQPATTLSGGEAQKLAIARALYKDTPLVILDEPTSALDPISEYEIYTKFDSLVHKKTAIYISHRMSSCKFCDNIIVFDKGKIIQEGSHEKLSTSLDGLYYKMWSAQAKYYN